MSQAIPSVKYNDVEHQVKVAAGYVHAVNQISQQKEGVVAPILDTDKIERSIRKRHAKFYGLDSKYDGKGNLRSLTY